MGPGSTRQREGEVRVGWGVFRAGGLVGLVWPGPAGLVSAQGFGPVGSGSLFFLFFSFSFSVFCFLFDFVSF